MKLKKFLIEALVDFLAWTPFLTLYMVLLVRSTTAQFLLWVLIQAILVPPIAAIVFWITLQIEKKVLK